MAAGLIALAISIVGLSTREPSQEFRDVEGAGDSQRIFGGARQLGERLGEEGAPVQLQIFTDVQVSRYADWFLEVVPALTNGPVRNGQAKLLLRNRSLTRNPTELSFFGVEAAAEQNYAWNYAYLVVRNLDLARDVGLDDEFLESIGESIEGLDLPVWRNDYEEALEPDSEVSLRLEEQDKLAIDLELRASPAVVVAGPAGTEVLQDTPALSELQVAIDEVQ